MPMRSASARPLVSVIIPTHDRAEPLMEAIESVRAQSYAPIETIVVDDGSTDGTAQRLRAAHDVRLLCIDHTGRPGAVRNAGAAIAAGDYLAFLDSDDLWMPEKLDAQMASLLRAGARTPVVHCREHWIRDGRTVSQAGQRHRRAGRIFAESVRKCVIGPSTVLMRRAVLEEVGGFREDLEIAEDYELWLRVTARFPVAYCDRPMVIKRAGRGDQLSERYGHVERFRIDALAPLVAAGRWAEPERTIARRELARKCLIHAAGARKRGRRAEAERYEALAAEAWPGASPSPPSPPPPPSPPARKFSISAANAGSAAAYSRIDRR